MSLDGLMSKMTLEEKTGLLNLLPGGDITKGDTMSTPLAQMTEDGKFGTVLNVEGQEKIKELQRIAVKKICMGILLLINQDVTHGNQTVFPIPLSQPCSLDKKAIKNGARNIVPGDITLNITFDSPMREGISIGLSDKELPEYKGHTWSADHRTISISFHTEPSTTYGMVILGDNFVSTDGRPAVESELTFSTR